MATDDHRSDRSPAPIRNQLHVYLVIVAPLLASLLFAGAIVGPRFLRAYRTIRKQFDAESDYVDRVKKEAEGR